MTKDKLRNQAAMWIQIEEVAHEPAVMRYARKKYEQCMRRLEGKPLLRLA